MREVNLSTPLDSWYGGRKFYIPAALVIMGTLEPPVAYHPVSMSSALKRSATNQRLQSHILLYRAFKPALQHLQHRSVLGRVSGQIVCHGHLKDLLFFKLKTKCISEPSKLFLCYN